MADTPPDQIALWNGHVGAKWAAMADQLDIMLAAANQALAARVGDVAGMGLLEIGCGSGDGSLLWVERGAAVTGVDVSAPMLAVARSRLQGRAVLIEADAAAWRGEELFDLAVSQFGVMFFEEPAAAFRNIAANLRPGGRLVFVCWRSVAENPWVTIPLAAVGDLVAGGGMTESRAPGPFAFAEPDYVRSLLRQAGFLDVSFRKIDIPLCIAASGGVDAAVDFLMRIGPTSAALAEAGDAAVLAAPARLRPALMAHEREGRVSLGGAAWLVEAVLA